MASFARSLVLLVLVLGVGACKLVGLNSGSSSWHGTIDGIVGGTVSGTVSGLSGTGLVLQNNGWDNLSISANGSFTFGTGITSGASYSVTVLTQPGSPNQTCTVTNGSGTVISASITSVQVSCVTNTYLFYKNPLSAVDPANSTVSIAIEPPGTAIDNVTAIEDGRYLPAPSYLVSDRHYRTIVYHKTSAGTLWKVNTLTGGSLTPVQVSNESTATICATQGAPDYANPDNAEFLYRLPGADGICGNADDVWKMIKVGMSAADAPYAAFQPLAAVRDPVTGAISGWLAINGSSLNAYDANFGNPVLVSTFTTSASKVMTSSDGRIVLNIDSSLRVYNPNASPAVLSGTLYTVSSSIGNAVRDNLNLYFSDGTSLYKLPLDGSASAAALATGAAGGVNSMMLTDNRVVWTNNSGATLMSVSKSGGAVTTLGTTWSLVGTAGNRIYYNTLVFIFGGSSVYTAHVINDDGTGHTQLNNAVWTALEPTTVDYGRTSNSLSLDTVLLREGAAAAPFSLSSYDAASHTVIASLGSFPADMNSFTNYYFMKLPNVNNLLVQAYSSSNGSYDVLLLNTAVANSMVRVTNTSAVNETPVGASGCSINARAKLDPTLIVILLSAIGCMCWRARRSSAKPG
ncbi:MAG: hypothetical protein ACYDBW_08085 [Sulfuricaulis sp.]